MDNRRTPTAGRSSAACCKSKPYLPSSSWSPWSHLMRKRLTPCTNLPLDGPSSLPSVASALKHAGCPPVGERAGETQDTLTLEGCAAEKRNEWSRHRACAGSLRAGHQVGKPRGRATECEVHLSKPPSKPPESTAPTVTPGTAGLCKAKVSPLSKPPSCAEPHPGRPSQRAPGEDCVLASPHLCLGGSPHLSASQLLCTKRGGHWCCAWTAPSTLLDGAGHPWPSVLLSSPHDLFDLADCPIEN